MIIAAGAAGFFFTKSRLLGSNKSTLGASSPSSTQKPTPNYSTTIGNFLITDKELIKENGKPAVYLFGSSTCPHCSWEKPLVREVVDKFKNEIVYHENFDDPNKDADIFSKYSDINPGYVPFIILGGKYARVGAGENLGANEEESKKLEKEALTAILCKLTEGKPGDVCATVKSKTAEIK